MRHFPELAPLTTKEEEPSGPSKSELILNEMIENLKNPHDTIKVKDLNEAISSDTPPTIVDIRIPGDYQDSHIPGSINIPQDDLGSSGDLPEDREAPIITVCNIGKFSKHATLYLKSKGYRNVRSAKGGLNEWVRKGFSTETSAVGS